MELHKRGSWYKKNLECQALSNFFSELRKICTWPLCWRDSFSKTQWIIQAFSQGVHTAVHFCLNACF